MVKVFNALGRLNCNYTHSAKAGELKAQVSLAPKIRRRVAYLDDAYLAAHFDLDLRVIRLDHFCNTRLLE